VVFAIKAVQTFDIRTRRTAAKDSRTVQERNPTVRTLKSVALLLVIVGAVNWLLVGLAKFDLVAALTGSSFGETNVISSIVYILVGLSGAALLPTLAQWFMSDSEAVTA
jgi:uncharacterized membrane protein YuzA (DUF378 family)